MIKEKIKKSEKDEALDLRNVKLEDENNKIYKILKKHNLLKILIIEFNSTINDTHILQIGQDLTYINLNGCQNITDRSLIHISKTCPNLKRLEIYWIPNITDKGLMPIIQNCRKIEYLNLSGCKYITSQSFLEIPKNLKDLTHIDLTRCFGVTDEILVELIKELKNLKYLNLYALSYLNCDFLKVLAELNKEPKLEFIDLCGNQNINDEIFSKFENSNSLNNLNYLNLTWCAKISDISVEILSRKLNDLELLSLHGILGISDKSIEFLSSNKGIVNNLQTLDVNGCKNILNKEVTYLKSKFPNVKCFNYHF